MIYFFGFIVKVSWGIFSIRVGGSRGVFPGMRALFLVASSVGVFVANRVLSSGWGIEASCERSNKRSEGGHCCKRKPRDFLVRSDALNNERCA